MIALDPTQRAEAMKQGGISQSLSALLTPHGLILPIKAAATCLWHASSCYAVNHAYVGPCSHADQSAPGNKHSPYLQVRAEPPQRPRIRPSPAFSALELHLDVFFFCGLDDVEPRAQTTHGPDICSLYLQQCNHDIERARRALADGWTRVNG